MVNRRKIYGHPSGFDPKKFSTGVRQPTLVKPNPVSGIALIAGNEAIADRATAEAKKTK